MRYGVSMDGFVLRVWRRTRVLKAWAFRPGFQPVWDGPGGWCLIVRFRPYRYVGWGKTQ